jgi:(Z)-2-((N-methylformamido)methylene)-5-hydroxybutyrolactone dehydrogenase
MFIGGQWVNGSEGESFETVNPYNQEAWASIPQATKADVESAIDIARRTFRSKWRKVNGVTRGNLMVRLAERLESEAERLGRLETTDNGKLLRESVKNMTNAARYYRFFAGYADKIYGEVIPMDNLDLFDFTIREPIGTVALITPWNSPISILANKLAPALATGNTVVIKPSEHTSVTTLEFARMAQEVGFPDGVINVVTGDGKVGNWLSSSPDIGKISFTGGTATAKLIAANASANLVPLLLELGGKSPNIIFDDADVDKAVAGAAGGIFGASGQTCIAGSRLLVQRRIHDRVADALAARADKIRLGNPLEDSTDMGPVANTSQYTRIQSMIDGGIAAGAQALAGSRRVDGPELGKGLFIRPTVLAGVNNQMAIAREEVFGPVLSIMQFDHEEEAVEIANDSRYGLAAGIWTKDMARAHRLSRVIEAGQVWVNTYRVSGAQVPFGGVKQSGYGRERGFHSLMEYTQIKNVMMDVS